MQTCWFVVFSSAVFTSDLNISLNVCPFSSGRRAAAVHPAVEARAAGCHRLTGRPAVERRSESDPIYSDFDFDIISCLGASSSKRTLLSVSF